MTREVLLNTARSIYTQTQCAGVGCCGDLEGMLEYIDGALDELVQSELAQRKIDEGRETIGQ